MNAQLGEREPRLVAYIHLSAGDGIDSVVPTTLKVVDEAYPSDPETVWEAPLRGGERDGVGATQNAATEQLKAAGYVAGAGGWRRNPGRRGWFGSAHKTRSH